MADKLSSIAEGEVCRKEINDLVNPIIIKITSTGIALNEPYIALLEEAANAIKSFRPEEAKDLFLKCYETLFKSQKTLRGLGVHYSKLWREKAKQKTQDENQGEIENDLKNALNSSQKMIQANTSIKF